MSSKPRFVGEWVRLGDVLEVVHGKNQKAVKDENGKYPIYGSGGQMGWANSYICPENTVIIGRKGNINKPIYVAEPFWNVDTAFGLVANAELLNPRYLFHFCEFFDFERLNTTCTIPSLTRKNVEAIELQLPPIGEQKAIVSQLDSILACIEVANRQINELDQLVKSRFVEMFGGGDLYPLVKLGDVFFTSSGGTPSSKRAEYYEGGSIPWLTSGEVNQDSIIETKRYITQDGFDNSSAKWVPADSVVIAMYGATAGKSGLLKIESTTNQAVCAIWPNDSYSAVYLLHAIRQKESWMIEQVAGGAQPNISQTTIKNMQLANPPLVLQQEFANFVSQADKPRFIAQQQIEKLQTLYDSLAQEYFVV